MAVKRILSCLTMISIVCLLSCYDVDYDKKDKNNSSTEWYDGLTNEQVVKAMMITATPVETKTKEVTSTEADTVYEIVWTVPAVLPFTKKDNWSIKWGYCLTNDNDGDLTWNDLLNTEFAAGEIQVEPLSNGQNKFWLTVKPPKISGVYLISYKIILNDSNGAQYENIVSFAVYPNNGKLKITVSPESERAAKTQLFGYWLTSWNLNSEPSREISLADPAPQLVENVAAYCPVIFKIKSDLSSIGIEDSVSHYSNSSYCKTTRITKNSGALATFKLSFEDLPQDMITKEDGNEFDYDDVIIVVDVIQ